jgi:hypothetical protein
VHIIKGINLLRVFLKSYFIYSKSTNLILYLPQLLRDSLIIIVKRNVIFSQRGFCVQSRRKPAVLLLIFFSQRGFVCSRGESPLSTAGIDGVGKERANQAGWKNEFTDAAGTTKKASSWYSKMIIFGEEVAVPEYRVRAAGATKKASSWHSCLKGPLVASEICMYLNPNRKFQFTFVNYELLIWRYEYDAFLISRSEYDSG